MQRSSSQYSAQQQASDFKVITPLYKTNDNPSTERSVGGGSLADLTRRHAETNGDYKAERTQESFRMQIIDPKVDTNAHIPAHGQTQFPRHKPLMDDFPSQHNKRSLLKLDAMEQRKIRSTESRPITTNAYLNESLDRHRAMEASKPNEESLRELEQIRKSIETLQKISNEPKKHDDLDELSRKNRELAERSRSRRQDFKIVESEIIKTEPPPAPLKIETKPWPHMPANLRPVGDSPQSTMTRELNETYARRINRYNSMPALETASSRGTLIRLQEEKPRSIMKVREIHEVVSKPKVTETVQRVEERKRTEEIERRVLRRERRHKSHRSRYGHSSHQEALGWHGGGSGYRTNSMTRGGGGYDSGYSGSYIPPAYPQYNNNHQTSHHNAYYGYDFPPAYPRRTASAMLYH